MNRILLVEDHERLAQLVSNGLGAAGIAVDAVQRMDAAWYALQQVPYGALVLDRGLPDGEGMTLLKRLRASELNIPCLILSARDALSDRVEGLDAGADDYVAKPFHFEEVLARLQALMRRSGGWASSNLVCGPVVLDTRAQTVSVEGKPVELTTFEYRILEHLILKAGEVISKTDLTEQLYEQDFERDSNVIEVFIGRLRRKLDPEDRIKPIETLRGRGYRFALARSAG